MESPFHGRTIGTHGRRRAILRLEKARGEDGYQQNETGAAHDYFWTTSFMSGSMDAGTVRDTWLST